MHRARARARRNHAAGHHGESFLFRFLSSFLHSTVVSLLSLSLSHSSHRRCTFTSSLSSPYIRACIAPLTNRTNATPRHSRQPMITAVATVSARTQPIDGDLSYALAPASLAKEKERFVYSSFSHPRRTTSLAQQRELLLPRDNIHIRFLSHACALCNRVYVCVYGMCDE